MKATEARVRSALDRPPADIRLYLFHGPAESTGFVLAGRLAKALGPEAERIDLDGATLKSDPARLADEAAAISLFGGARFIRVSGAGEESLAAVEALLAAERAGNPVVMIAPSAKTTGKLVKLALESDRVLALACYPANDRDAAATVGDLARERGLRLGAGVAAAIARGSEGDRAIMAREIEKLSLYLDSDADRPADAELADVAAIGADLAEGETGAIVEALTAGDPRALALALRLMDGADGSPIPILRAVGRRLILLAELRQGLDSGEAFDTLAKRHRLHFREAPSIAAAMPRWPATRIDRAIAIARGAERAAIGAGAAGGALADMVLLDLARAGGVAPGGARSVRR